MSTKTMRLPPRRVLTVDQPRGNGEQPDAVKRPSTAATPWFRKPISAQTGTPRAAASTTVSVTKTGAGTSIIVSGVPAGDLTRSNQLLAGYLAHEFLTSRTLFGEPWETPPRAAGVLADESRKRNRAVKPSPQTVEEKRRRYVEVCHLLKAGDGHLAGVVNPSQLAGILKLR